MQILAEAILLPAMLLLSIMGSLPLMAALLWLAYQRGRLRRFNLGKLRPHWRS